MQRDYDLELIANAFLLGALEDQRDLVRRMALPINDSTTIRIMIDEIAHEAASAGKHVLIEKPGARRACELDSALEASRCTGALVRVGFNHRYHRAFRPPGGCGPPVRPKAPAPRHR